MGLLPSPSFVNDNHSHNKNHSQLSDFPNFAKRCTSQTSQTLQSVNDNHSHLETLQSFQSFPSENHSHLVYTA